MRKVLSFEAASAIPARSFVKFTEDMKVEAATLATDKIIGISDTVNFEAGDMADIYLNGEICELEAGGTITAGDVVTSDSEGKAVVADSANYGAIALDSAVDGDIIRAIVTISRATATESDNTETTETEQNP